MFELEEGTVKVTPEQLALPAFRAIYEADKSKAKTTAFKELSYIFFFCDFKSPYFSYPIEKRRKLISGQIFKDENYEPSELIKEGIRLYKSLNETPEMRLLRAWEGKIDSLASFLEEVKIDTTNINKLTKAGIDTEKIISSVQKLRELVEKQISQKSHIRGGKSEAMFES